MKDALIWQPQELPFDHPDCCRRFRLDGDKHVVATRHAAIVFTREQITGALELLQREAEIHNGLEFFQTFKDSQGRRLWIIEDDLAIVAITSEHY